MIKFFPVCCSLDDIIKKLHLDNGMDLDLSSNDYENTMLLEFSRDFLLEDALMHAQMPTFDPKKTLKVSISTRSNNSK